MFWAVPASTVVIASTMSEAEHAPALGVRDRQRHRAALLDHRRGVAVRDPRELVAPARGVEVGLVVDLVEVQVEDVEPVVLGRRPEPDVAPHPSRPGQRRVEHLDRDVARADEVDLLLARARRREPQRQGPILRGTTNIASRNVLNRLVKNFRIIGGSSIPSITTSSWLSACPPPPPIPPSRGGSAGSGRRPPRRTCVAATVHLGALCEQPLAPCSGLDHEIAGRGERAVRAEEAEVVQRSGLAGVTRPGRGPARAPGGASRPRRSRR